MQTELQSPESTQPGEQLRGAGLWRGGDRAAAGPVHTAGCAGSLSRSVRRPLDLLLYLIRKQNIDILDIPVAEITRQYGRLRRAEVGASGTGRRVAR